MTVEDSDLKLVERVQRGERAAFDLLVLRYQHKVLKLIMRYVHDATEAEDIAQEAFVKAFRALHSFRGDSAFYTWLYRIAINTAKNALVATKRRPMDYDLDLQDPEQYDLHARLAESETPISPASHPYKVIRRGQHKTYRKENVVKDTHSDSLI
jgi:RNA polymerase sigma-70 factor (ECF subfamily)